jgi:pimeloyl-ACP methyl ester carboxylesterase
MAQNKKSSPKRTHKSTGPATGRPRATSKSQAARSKGKPVRRQAKPTTPPKQTATPRAPEAAAPMGTLGIETPSANVETNAAPSHFIVLIPGFMGSKLRDRTTGETVWVDFSTVPLNPLQWQGWFDNLYAKMCYPNDNLEPAGIVDDVIFAPPWIKQEQYSRLLRMLEGWGYKVDPQRYTEDELDVYTFAYDWRQDNRLSGRQLKAAVDGWRAHHPGAQVWLMGHSNGGIIARWYIEKEGGKDVVSRLVLLASPWDGAVQAMHILFQGLDVLFRVRFNLFNVPQITRDALRTFPSAYQLIPQMRDFLRGPNNQVVDPFAGDGWLDPKYHALLQDGRQFKQELGNTLSVETLAFFGRTLPTVTGGQVNFRSGTQWDHIDWIQTTGGDGTLPEYTAVFPTTNRNIPVVAEHGNIYVSPALYQILRWELVDKYKGLPVGTLGETLPQTRAIVTTDQKVYDPGGTIQLQVTAETIESSKPVSGADIRARLAWTQALPGSAISQGPSQEPVSRLQADPATPGRYTGSLTIPMVEGYYQLTTTVSVLAEPDVTLEQLIVVEAMP